MDISVERLWHSGKKRAEQTAEVLAEAVEVHKGQIAREGLGPNDDVGPVKNQLDANE